MGTGNGEMVNIHFRSNSRWQMAPKLEFLLYLAARRGPRQT